MISVASIIIQILILLCLIIFLIRWLYVDWKKRNQKITHPLKEYVKEIVSVLLLFGIILLTPIFITYDIINPQINGTILLPDATDNIQPNDWLLFVGSLIGGCAAFAAIFVTYLQTNRRIEKEQEEARTKSHEDRVNALKPFLAIIPLPNADIKGTPIDISVMVKIDEDKLGFQPEEIHLSQFGISDNKFQIKNVGSNSAVDILLLMNDKIISTGNAIGKDDSLFLNISNSYKVPIQSWEIEFKFKYLDLDGNKYEQCHNSSVELQPKIIVNKIELGMPRRINEKK